MRSMLKPEQWKALADKACLDDRTVAKLALREYVRSDIRRRVEQAAEQCGITLPRSFFAQAPSESAA